MIYFMLAMTWASQVIVLTHQSKYPRARNDSFSHALAHPRWPLFKVKGHDQNMRYMGLFYRGT